MNALIPDIETLKKVVKINSSLPYESIEPYIEDALGALSGWDGVLNVGLVSISYEDELENKEIGRARVGKECRSRWSPYH